MYTTVLFYIVSLALNNMIRNYFSSKLGNARVWFCLLYMDKISGINLILFAKCIYLVESLLGNQIITLHCCQEMKSIFVTFPCNTKGKLHLTFSSDLPEKNSDRCGITIGESDLLHMNNMKIVTT